jgi:hypothetical protein
MLLNNGEYVVVCNDSIAFYNQFHMSCHQYSGSLNNTSDSIKLYDGSSVLIDVVPYLTVAPWPTAANAGGPSIALCDPSADNSMGANWSLGNRHTGVIMIDRELYAHPGRGCVVGDSVPPIPYRAQALSATQVQVVFDEAVTTATGTNVANYTGLTSVSSVTLNATRDTALINLSTPLVNGTIYTLHANNFADAAGNVLTVDHLFTISYNTTTTGLVIDEIFYNDPVSSPDTIEFVEMYNPTASAISLGGYTFSAGIIYNFPAMSLNPGEYYTLCKDSVSFYSVFHVSAHQWASGSSLSNSGENVRIDNSVGALVDSVHYLTSSPWDSMANGGGYSLVVCKSDLTSGIDNSLASSWHKETSVAANQYSYGGITLTCSPGRDNCAVVGIENVAALQVSVYPNPFQDQFTIQNAEADAVHATLTDIRGNVLQEFVLSPGNVEVSTLGYAKGMYFLHLNNEKTHQTHNFKLMNF